MTSSKAVNGEKFMFPINKSFDYGISNADNWVKVKETSKRTSPRQSAGKIMIDGPLRKGRGHYKAMLKFKIFLLGEPTDTLPSQKLQRKLKDQGMGSPKHGEKWSILRKSWTTKELEDYILSLYPGIPLNLVGFNFGKASKTRKIEKVDFQSVSQLKKSVQRGKLFVIPKRTLMEPETSCQDDLPDESSDSDDTDHESIQSTVNIADLPIITTVRPRRKRRAASRVARAQIREWCNRGTHELSRVSSDEENASILVLNDDASHAEGSIPGHATEAVVSDTYRNYVENVICIDESDEEFDMEKSSGVEDDNQEIEDMSYILTKLSSTINKETVTRFNIHRPTIWDCTLRKLKRGFDPRNELLIKFSDDFCSTEAGIDQGGPKREYLNLILEYIINSKLFEGGDNNKTLSWLKSANDKDEYFYAGLMIAVCLVHGGPAPHCFAPCFVEALEKGPMKTKVSLKDMPDPELKAQLEKVLDQSQQDLFKALEDIPFLKYAGIDYYTCSPDQTNSFVSRVVHAYLFDRASQSFERFRCGLQTLGVMESLKELFLVKNVTLNRVSFEDIFKYTLSPEMSNTRQRETSIVALWRDFLEDVESGKAKVTFSKILQFCTGSKVIPPLGFHPKPTISFQYQRFPKGITCTNNLILPLQTCDFEEFVSNLEFGILNTEGFLLE